MVQNRRTYSVHSRDNWVYTNTKVCQRYSTLICNLFHGIFQFSSLQSSQVRPFQQGGTARDQNQAPRWTAKESWSQRLNNLVKKKPGLWQMRPSGSIEYPSHEKCGPSVRLSPYPLFWIIWGSGIDWDVGYKEYWPASPPGTLLPTFGGCPQTHPQYLLRFDSLQTAGNWSECSW